MRRVMLFISSYIPLYVLLILKNILERSTSGGRFSFSFEYLKNIQLFDEVNDYAICVLLLMSVISFWYLKQLTKRDSGKHYYKMIELDNQTGNMYFNYISVYLLSCLGLSLQSIVDVFILFFLMLLVGCIYVSNHMTYMNPVLQFMGFKVYEGTVKSSSTNKEIYAIILVDKDVEIIDGREYIGSGKEDFIHLTKINEESN